VIQPTATVLTITLLSALILPDPAAAIPLSVGASHQIQVGWQSFQGIGTRLTRIQESGTSGENIRPNGGVFALYGTPFTPDPRQESFDYSSINRDTSTVRESRSSGFSVLGTSTTTLQTTNPEPLGFFSGNSTFQQ
jgi:hypothetical protein